ncbi:MAG: hypothetical protein EOP86_08395 [Verrucomicrobiaceae bacterium]|nr:MAG: hypothetical protein EOP86_08395 [Verrucomicrobiaceae bacterium]
MSHPHGLDETLSRMNIRSLGLWSAGYLTLPARVLWRERALEQRIPGFVRELGRILAVMIHPVPGDFTIMEGYNGPQEFVDSVAVWLATFDTIGRAANVTYMDLSLLGESA